MSWLRKILVYALVVLLPLSTAQAFAPHACDHAFEVSAAAPADKPEGKHHPGSRGHHHAPVADEAGSTQQRGDCESCQDCDQSCSSCGTCVTGMTPAAPASPALSNRSLVAPNPQHDHLMTPSGPPHPPPIRT